MFTNRTEKFMFPIALKSSGCFVSSLLLIFPAWGGDTAKDEETLMKANALLTATLISNGVPHDVLSRADCVIVLPCVKNLDWEWVETAVAAR